MMINNIADSPTVTITTTGDFNTSDTIWVGDPVDGLRDTAGVLDWTYQPLQDPWKYQSLQGQWADRPIVYNKNGTYLLEEFMNEYDPYVKKTKTKKKGEFYIMKRLVQVVVVDPDKRVSDSKSVVHMGEAHVTSLADEDLLLEVDLKNALKIHNDVRKTIVDEDRSDKRNKEVYLKPVKISELEVKVITIAKF